MDPLIISFTAGTSGRFIATISRQLYLNSSDTIEWTEDNSAHNFSHFNKGFWINAPAIFNNGKYVVGTPMVYEYLHLEPNDIMTTHAYPNFKLIKEKFPNCKIIVMGWTKDNLNEIMFNHIKKNKLPILPNEYSFFVSNKSFIDLEMPVDNNILVIMYDEIYKEENNSYIGLNKLSQFLNMPVNETILHNYKLYVDGRSQLLQKNNIAKI